MATAFDSEATGVETELLAPREDPEEQRGAEQQPASAEALLRQRMKRATLAAALAAALLLAWAGDVAIRSGLQGSSRAAQSVQNLDRDTSMLALVANGSHANSSHANSSHSCTGPGENCLPSKCCDMQGFKCFEKSKDYASCKPSCKAGIDPQDPPKFQTPWTCKVLGGPGPNAKPAPPPPAPAAPANSGCYLVDDGKLLMVKHSYGTFDIPGGLAEAGEMPEKTACRETWEETGYKVTATGLKTVTSNGFHIFNCKLLDPKPAGSPDPAEVSAVMWNPLNALPQAGWRFQEELALFR